MMNKVGLVLGVAAIATLAGCKDPNYKSKRVKVQDEPKIATPVQQQEPEVLPPADVTPVKDDVKVIEDVKPIETKSDVKPLPPSVTPVPPAHAAAETTTYIVQRGDYLAKISKKFNVTITGIKKANPQIKNDVVKVGQKIQIPGKHEVGEQKVPAGAIAAAPAKAKTAEYKPYAGATKEYVVKNGDSLGKIACSNGINIRQLKELNGLADNNIRIGQKLKVPAEKAAAAAPVVVEKKSVEVAKPVVEKKTVEAPKVVEKKIETTEPAPVVVEPTPAVADTAPEAAKAADEGVTHIVEDGEDITSISIHYSVDPAEIRQLNNLREGDELKAGQVIKLPAEAQF